MFGRWNLLLPWSLFRWHFFFAGGCFFSLAKVCKGWISSDQRDDSFLTSRDLCWPHKRDYCWKQLWKNQLVLPRMLVHQPVLCCICRKASEEMLEGDDPLEDYQATLRQSWPAISLKTVFLSMKGWTRQRTQRKRCLWFLVGFLLKGRLKDIEGFWAVVLNLNEIETQPWFL